MPGYKAFRERRVNEATKDMYMIMQIQPTNNARGTKGTPQGITDLEMQLVTSNDLT